MRNVPKPPKPLNKRFCAILTRASYDENHLFICKSFEGEVRQEYQATSEEESECESELDTDSDIGECPNPMFAMLRKAEKEMINERIREKRPQILERKIQQESEANSKKDVVEDDLDTDSDVSEGHGPRFTKIMKARKKMINRRKRKERAERLLGMSAITIEEAAKFKHEDNYENVQLNGTSLGMISMFCTGFEHERVLPLLARRSTFDFLKLRIVEPSYRTSRINFTA